MQYRQTPCRLRMGVLTTCKKKHKLVIFYKTINELTPEYLREIVPPLVQEASTYALRNADHIQTIHASSNLYYNSFSLPLSGHGILSLMKLNLHRT